MQNPEDTTMTVAQLRQAIANVPDNAVIQIVGDGAAFTLESISYMDDMELLDNPELPVLTLQTGGEI
jgi:hypothetical protein